MAAATGVFVTQSNTADASTGGASTAGDLAACPFWTNAPVPARPFNGPTDAETQSSPVSFAGRLAAPAFTGQLSNGTVTLHISPVPGAVAYAVWRDSVSLETTMDSDGNPVTITDPDPCLNATYNVAALANLSEAPETWGRLSAPLALSSSGALVPWQPAQASITATVTAYNDNGQTDIGYESGVGICAVDPRVIPLGIYFTVAGYGSCYSADIGTWIQDDAVDIWLPGTQADDWGVQKRTVTLSSDASPIGGAPMPPPPITVTPTPTPSPTPTHRKHPTPVPTSSTTTPPTTAPSAPSSPASHSVADPGFEDIDLAAWHCDATAALVTDAHGGHQALRLSPTDQNDATCSQSVEVRPDTTYTLSAWIKGSNGYLGASAGAEAMNWAPAGAGWQRLVTSVTTDPSVTSMTVYIHCWYGLAPLSVDSVTLTGGT